MYSEEYGLSGAYKVRMEGVEIKVKDPRET
jgi:hypothetical protein